jgi:PAS domain S-box-containing protein
LLVQLNAHNILEILAIFGSGTLAFSSLVLRQRSRSTYLFSLFCFLTAVWKAFDFAYPTLSSDKWVDSMGWFTGLLVLSSAYLFVLFFVTERRQRELRPFSAWPLLFLGILLPTSAAGLMHDSLFWKVLYVLYFLLLVVIMARELVSYYQSVSGKGIATALLGSLVFVASLVAYLVDYLHPYTDLRPHTYGMLAFQATLFYDLLFRGHLEAEREHVRVIQELGLKEKMLEEAETRFRKLLDNSFDIIFTMDPEGNILAINTDAEEILGFPVREMLGKGYLRFLPPEERMRAADALARGFRGEKIRFFEIRLVRPDGKPVFLQVSATRLFQQGVSALVIARDVTEARKMERELEERNRRLEEANRRLRELDTFKTEVVGIVGHELRSPLTVIFSYAAALKDHWDKMKEERKLDCVDHILAECNRLNRMVENILDLSRVESERLFLHRTRRDLISFLSEVAREMSITPGARPVELDLPSGELVMELDWDKMKQVLINLLDNAFRFSPDGERVKVSVVREDDSVVVKVADRGPGVPPEDRERLFDKFTQRKGEGMEKGLGLGLYIVRTFVEAHGGRVWVEDGAETGAVFAFSLPLRGEGG